MNETMSLSVAIITKDEADNLPACLESIRFADQVVVVDSDSIDDTVRIASDFGCDVFIEKWRSFGPQKQFAIDQCKHRWVLVLDADERIPPETALVIEDIVSRKAGSSRLQFPTEQLVPGPMD